MYLCINDIIAVKEFSDIVENARSNDIDLKLLKKLIQALWERSHKKVRGKEYSPSAVVFIDANSSPDRIVPYLGQATASKVSKGQQHTKYFFEIFQRFSEKKCTVFPVGILSLTPLLMAFISRYLLLHHN